MHSMTTSACFSYETYLSEMSKYGNIHKCTADDLLRIEIQIFSLHFMLKSLGCFNVCETLLASLGHIITYAIFGSILPNRKLFS